MGNKKEEHAIDSMQPIKPKVFITLWSFTERICWSLSLEVSGPCVERTDKAIVWFFLIQNLSLVIEDCINVNNLQKSQLLEFWF